MSGLLLLLLSPIVASLPQTYIRQQSHTYSYGSFQPQAVVKSNTRTVPLPYKQAFLNIPSVSLTGSGDIIQQTRTQAESLKKDLRSMASHPRAAQILNRVFADKNNVCIKSMDDAIEAIETSTKLMENAGTEIKQLIETVKVFEKRIDAPTAVRETANILRLLDVLITKMTPDTSSTCRSTSADVFGSMSSLGVLVDELSSKDNIYFSTQKRQSLKSSAKIVTKVTNFLSKLKRSFSKFDRICTKNKDYNIEIITAMGDMMTDLTDLYRAVGGSAAAEEISEQRDFTKKVVVSTILFSNYQIVNSFFAQSNLNKLGDLDLITLNCNTPGAPQLIANALDDLAGLIEEVGIDNLCNQLDLDCVF